MKRWQRAVGIVGLLTCLTSMAVLAAQTPKKKGSHPVVTMETTKGTVVMELYPEDAPKTVANFVKLVKEKFYDGIIFHRVIRQPNPFVVQGGDPLTKTKSLDDPSIGTGGPGYEVAAEIKRKHVRGAVAMARKGDAVNPEKKSSGSQFYICLADLPHLDQGGYTVFGMVTKGMDVVDKIEKGDKIKKMTVKMP